MKNEMNLTLESRRKMVVDWMIDLPFGENDDMIEKAIDNAILQGRDRSDVINLISSAFAAELNTYIEWCDSMNSRAFID